MMIVRQTYRRMTCRSKCKLWVETKGGGRRHRSLAPGHDGRVGTEITNPFLSTHSIYLPTNTMSSTSTEKTQRGIRLDVAKIEKLVMEYRFKNLVDGREMGMMDFYEKAGIDPRMYKRMMKSGYSYQKNMEKLERILLGEAKVGKNLLTMGKKV